MAELITSVFFAPLGRYSPTPLRKPGRLPSCRGLGGCGGRPSELKPKSLDRRMDSRGVPEIQERRLMKCKVLGAALIASKFSGAASAQDNSAVALSRGRATGLNEIPQLRGPIMDEPDTISTRTSSIEKFEEMSTVLRGTKSSRLPKNGDRVNAGNNAGKLRGTASVGVISSGQLSRPTDFDRRPGGAW
jgi:hypothetical protein